MRSAGKRVELVAQEGGFQRLLPGQYGKWTDGIGNVQWYGCTPNGHGCNLSAHKITEHEDGTISVEPSIGVETTINGSPRPVVVWHGFLERGVWREA